MADDENDAKPRASGDSGGGDQERLDEALAAPDRRLDDVRPVPRPVRNMVASVTARLLNLAHAREEELQLVLIRYGFERLLYRLGRSPYAREFVVKGALLFALWAEEAEENIASGTEDARPPSARDPRLPRRNRATHDLDLLGYGSNDLGRLNDVFRQLGQVPVEEGDGLVFLPETVHAAPIREDQEYGGIRVRLLAMLGKARIPLQVDVGFGDVVTPAAAEVAFPILLRDLPAPRVRVYPRETVVAEKFEAMVRLGLPNTRHKDFYDLWTLANTFAFEGGPLCAALGATFARRGTALPGAGEEPVALTPRFGDDEIKQAQWAAFLRKGHLTAGPAPGPAPALPDVLAELRPFLLPPSAALAAGQTFSSLWPAGGLWNADAR